MEEQSQQQQQPAVAQMQAPFPLPPPFYQHFTNDNLAKLNSLRKRALTPSAIDERLTEPNGTKTVDNLDLQSVPRELRYLIPPSPPSDTQTYTSFGASLSLQAEDPTLSAAGIEQLYPSTSSTFTNPQPHMIALARSLLTTFLSLVGILSANPTLFHQSAEDLQTICFNIHDLINRYRPHQARESLLLMMEDRADALRAEMKLIESGKDKVEELQTKIQGFTAHHIDADSGSEGAPMSQEEESDVEKQRRSHQREAWKLLQDELDLRD